MTGRRLRLFWEDDRKRHARQRNRLVTAIRDLPSDCRDVFVLHRFAEQSVEQITEHLGIEKRAVETRLTEALARLSRTVDEAASVRPAKRK